MGRPLALLGWAQDQVQEGNSHGLSQNYSGERRMYTHPYPEGLTRDRTQDRLCQLGSEEHEVASNCMDLHLILFVSSCKSFQDGVITFTPTLPEPKLAALSRIRMGNAIKIILTFKKRFWPEKM